MGDPMASVVDYDRDEARTAARLEPDPWPEMTRAEAEREQADTFFDELHAMPVRPGPGRQPKEAA